MRHWPEHRNHSTVIRNLTEKQNEGIKAHNVSVIYPNGHKALWDASFILPQGTVCGLVGINGAGKSTLFKAMMGFTKLSRGSISIMGRTVSEALKENLISYVPQTEQVDWTFPVLVEDVVMMGRFGHMGFLRIPRKADHEAVEQALQRVNMQDYRYRQIGELSGGQRKRVFLARAIAQNGHVILLDEPFTGVDVHTEEQIIKLMLDLREEGRIILVSTHNLGSVPEFCDRTILIKGTILSYGETETTFTQENLQQAFGGVLRYFTLSGKTLHEDSDSRAVTILTDDERPLVQYDGKTKTKEGKSK
ncbi:MAG: manganese/iron ABC transporter ATP-binding protein [Candidatus Puniceispirillales bacterium]